MRADTLYNKYIYKALVDIKFPRMEYIGEIKTRLFQMIAASA